MDVDGDSARALCYMTSHQVFEGDPNTVKVLVGRYHDELKRTPDGWKISSRKAEFLWSETRTQDEEFIGALGGRGPESAPPRLTGVSTAATWPGSERVPGAFPGGRRVPRARATDA